MAPVLVSIHGITLHVYRGGVIGAGENEDDFIGDEVGHETYDISAAAVESDTLDKPGMEGVTQEILKIGNRHVVYGFFGLVVPAVGQGFPDRGPPAEHDLQPTAPVREVRETDNDLTADTH